MLGNRFFNRKPASQPDTSLSDKLSADTNPNSESLKSDSEVTASLADTLPPASEIQNPGIDQMDKKTIAEQGSGGFPGVGDRSIHGNNAIWYLADIPGRIQPGLTDEQKVIGPLTFAQMCQYASSGMIDQKNSLVWTEGMTDWVAAGEVGSFFTSSLPPKVPNKPLSKSSWLFKGFAFLFSIMCMIAMIPLLVIKAVFYGVKAARQKTGVPSLSLRTHWWASLFSQALFCIFLVLFMTSMEGPSDATVVFFVLGSVTAVVVHLFWSSMLCRLWAKVPEKYRKESPESLFPLFFVPVVHFYAMYLAIPSLRFAMHRSIHPGSEESLFERRALKVACVLCMIPGANLIGSLIMTGWLVSIRKEVAYYSEAKQKQWMPSKV